MLMHLFRRSIEPHQARVRRATTEDTMAVMQLIREAAWRYYGMTGNELPRLLARMPVMVAEVPAGLCGVVLPGWSSRSSVWLRGVALARGLTISDGLNLLLPALHSALQETGLRYVFYAGDAGSDAWLMPALQQEGYTIDTTVVVYEKKTLSIPTEGNLDVAIRRAQAADLPTLLELDSRCFEPHWTKDEALLENALREDALFVVAVSNNTIIGYAYATSHFRGRLVHLVRIAVQPQQQHGGVGARLLAQVIGYARQQNADIVTLNTQSYNEQAQRLYRWFGFQRNGEYQTVLRYDL